MRWVCPSPGSLGPSCSPGTGEQEDLVSVVRAGPQALPLLGRARIGDWSEGWGLFAGTHDVAGGVKRGSEVITFISSRLRRRNSVLYGTF